MAIVVGSVAVEVVPSAKGFREKLNAELRDMTAQVHVDPDLDGFREKVRAETAGLSTDVHVNVDQDGSARRSIEGIGRSAGGAGGGMSSLLLAGLALGPALIPVAAAVAAGVGAIGASAAIGATGLGAFALFAIPAYTKVADASKKLADAQKAVNDALTSKQRETALAKQAQLIASLSPATLAAVTALHSFTDAFKATQAALAPQIFGVFAAGLNVAKTALAPLAQLAKATAPALITLADLLNRALISPQVRSFFTFLAANIGPTLITFGRIIGNLALGIGGLIRAFQPLSDRVGASLLGVSQKFAGLLDNPSPGLQKFLAYVEAIGPKVGAAFSAIWRGLVNVAVALAPFGGAILVGITAVFNKLASVKPETIRAVAVAIVGVAVALKGIGLAGSVLALGPVGIALAAIGGAALFAYTHSAQLREWIQTRLIPSLRELVPVLRKDLKQALDGLRQGIDMVARAFKANEPELRKFGVQFVTLMKVIGPLAKATFILIGNAIATTITVIGLMERAFTVLRAVIATSLRLILSGFLIFVGTFLLGADKAFGWIKGIGPKIHEARKSFETAMKGIQAAIDAIDPGPLNNALSKAQLLAAAITSSGQQGRFAAQERAVGGPVRAGQPYIVGENRPELFIPDQSGTILPYVPSGGGGGGDTYNVYNPVPETVSESKSRIMRRRQWQMAT